MNRRRTVDASTLLDLNWSTNHFPLPPPDGASPIRPVRGVAASTSTALTGVSPAPLRRRLSHSTPQVQPEQCLETPPRQNLVVTMTSEGDDDDDDEAPISPRGAPDGHVEIEQNEEVANAAARIMRPSLLSRQGSLGGGRTETEDDESSSEEEDDEDDRSDVFEAEIKEEEQVG